jgi:hypothetical protein
MTELRMGKNNQWTPASLRDHFSWQISQIDHANRVHYAYNVLAGVATSSTWSLPQRRAIALGLEQGMKK